MTTDNNETMQTVLVVDDTPDNVALLSSLLKGTYKVKVATNGEKALSICHSDNPPDIILLDILMPDLDGYEVCRRLKESESLKGIPVIFLSALNETMDKLKAFSTGGVDYITKPFHAEEVKARVAMHLRLHQLQVALEQQNHDLQESYARLRELESLRDSLTHMIIHDMRTPLTSISGYLQLIQTYESEGLSNDCREFLTVAMNSTENLIGMVSSLLDISKMESGEMKLDRTDIDIAAIASEVFAKLDSLKEGRQLILDTPETPEIVRADQQLIYRVIQNLVGNALKFTPQTGEIRIGLTRDNSTVRVTVSDNGPGIPPQFRQKIFEKFGQVEARAHKQRYSTGLGLTFCKLAVEAHGGSIGVDSEVGKGSTFWFLLPGE